MNKIIKSQILFVVSAVIAYGKIQKSKVNFAATISRSVWLQVFYNFHYFFREF